MNIFPTKNGKTWRLKIESLTFFLITFFKILNAITRKKLMLAISGCGNLEILRFNFFLQFSEVQSLPQWAHVSYIMKRHIKLPYINMYMTIESWSYTGQIQRCPHPRCFETEKRYPGQVILSPFIVVLTWNTHVAWPWTRWHKVKGSACFGDLCVQ